MIEYDDTPLISESEQHQPSLFVWFSGVICLSLISLSSGSVNVFPSLIDLFKSEFHFSDSSATFMLSAGATLMYITLPAGMFMDKFGVSLTFGISIGITIISYVIMFFSSNNTPVFITFYLLMAFGSASLFITCLQIALSRAPPKIKGISVSIVSASLSMAFGFWFSIYGKGVSIFPKLQPLLAGFKSVGFFIIGVLVFLSPIAYFCYRNFQPSISQASGGSSFDVLKSPRLYLLLFSMLITVFDGMLVLLSGKQIWSIYDPKYESATADWSMKFSLTNCFFTITLSALLDYILSKYEIPRTKGFSFFWMIFSFIPAAISYAFQNSHSRTVFGILISMMGIPFGFGLTQNPAMTSDIFGNERYGFAFGIVQIGSIISAASTLPLMKMLEKTGITIVFLCAAMAHLITGIMWFLTKNEVEPSSMLKQIEVFLGPNQ